MTSGAIFQNSWLICNEVHGSCCINPCKVSTAVRRLQILILCRCLYKVLRILPSLEYVFKEIGQAWSCDLCDSYDLLHVCTWETRKYSYCYQKVFLKFSIRFSEKTFLINKIKLIYQSINIRKSQNIKPWDRCFTCCCFRFLWI